MKYYLIVLLLVIMGAGARTMFEIAHNALGMEHDSMVPDQQTSVYIFVTLWYILMMVADVLLLFYKEVRYRNVFIALLTIGIIAPTVYMYFTK
jgi:hypothetical protein